MGVFSALYLPESADRTDPSCSPGLSTKLSQLPPTLVVAASHDPLSDEASAFHDRLQEAGVASRFMMADGLPHGFLLISGVVPAAGRALDKALAEARELLK